MIRISINSLIPNNEKEEIMLIEPITAKIGSISSNFKDFKLDGTERSK